MSAQRLDSIPECFSFQFSLEEHVAPIVWLAWSPDGNSLASCSVDGSIIVWETSSGKSLGKLSGHHNAAISLAWTPDGNLLASGSYDQRILVWNANSLQEIAEISLQHGEVNDISWSPDGRILAAGCGDGTVILLEGREFKVLRTLEAGKNAVYSIQFSNDGSTLITSAADDNFVIWDTKGWFPIRKVETVPSDIFDISLSPDGKLLAAAGGGDGITLWETRTWSKSFTLKGHTDDISCVRFSYDGNYLASKSFDDTVRLWDVGSQKEIARLPEPSQNYWLSGFAWHPHRLSLASLGNGDTIIRLWDITPEKAFEPVSDRVSAKGTIRSRPASVPVPKPPSDLISACLDGNCVVFVGAGLAAPAGLPTWNDFVQTFVEWAVDEGMVKGEIAESLQEALAIGNAGQVADIVVSEIHQSPEGQSKINSYLAEIFTSHATTPPDTYEILKDIGFFAALTTNFDNLLELTFDQTQTFTPQDTDQLMVRLQTGEFFVLKLYGTVERPATVMLSPAQYESHVAENIVFSQFMESLFVSKTLFFVGASLEGIEVYLKALKIGSGHLTRRHYAYVNVVGNAWKVKADILERRYGIKVIPFPASPGFPEVNEFLTSISNKLDRRRNPELSGEHQIKPENKAPVLKSVELRNIGPFDELTLRLDPTWNVLLGDNGVGKSSILRALALAFIGEDGRLYADRLIKAGRTSASITLEFEGDDSNVKYITTLSQTTSGALVRSSPSAPIRVKNSLTLGFPALRTISWDRSMDVAVAGKEILLPEDLLPLLEGKPDPRLDRLRSWLVSLDHTIGSPDTPASVSERYSNLRDRFFEVIRELTPGLRVKYHGVDPISKVVLIETDDGIVPIEAVSQGTTSLLGWIGVFLQRYFDIYGHTTETTDKYALVLIDEIDAHMHPRWQQIIVKSLGDLFPNVQFIATTHSPLIIAGMPPSQLHCFMRNEDGIVEQVDVSQEMSDGRADQILTNDLFGLQSTRSLAVTTKMEEYSQLAVRRGQLTGEEEQRLEQLADELQVRLIGIEESAQARKAYSVLSDSIKKKIEDMSEENKLKIINQVQSNLLDIAVDLDKVP